MMTAAETWNVPQVADAPWSWPVRLAVDESRFGCRRLWKTRLTRTDADLAELFAKRAGELKMVVERTSHEALVERRARRGDLMLARTRTNHLVLVDLPPDSVGEYHRVRLTGTTGSTFTGAVVTPALAVL